ncbi:MAG: YrbL family protein, partial [Verrucomicrobiota bacterium]
SYITQNGFNLTTEKALNKLFAAMLENYVLIKDPGIQNILFQLQEDETPQAVIIDGIDSDRAIYRSRIWRRRTRRKIEKKIAKIERRLKEVGKRASEVDSSRITCPSDRPF